MNDDLASEGGMWKSFFAGIRAQVSYFVLVVWRRKAFNSFVYKRVCGRRLNGEYNYPRSFAYLSNLSMPFSVGSRKLPDNLTASLKVIELHICLKLYILQKKFILSLPQIHRNYSVASCSLCNYPQRLTRDAKEEDTQRDVTNSYTFLFSN